VPPTFRVVIPPQVQPHMLMVYGDALTDIPRSACY
jgi:hypothetical protein